jgi:hypothetical protein
VRTGLHRETTGLGRPRASHCRRPRAIDTTLRGTSYAEQRSSLRPIRGEPGSTGPFLGHHRSSLILDTAQDSNDENRLDFPLNSGHNTGFECLQQIALPLNSCPHLQQIDLLLNYGKPTGFGYLQETEVSTSLWSAYSIWVLKTNTLLYYFQSPYMVVSLCNRWGYHRVHTEFWSQYRIWVIKVNTLFSYFQ